MAAIALKRHSRLLTQLLFGSAMLCGASLRVEADQPAEVRSVLNDVAGALTASNPADAMTRFSKSFADYDKLRDYFIGLTAAFSIVNEVDVLDEKDTAMDSTATVRWTITLANAPVSGNSIQRSGEIHIHIVQEKRKWRIVQFSPIDLFDPSKAQTPVAKP